MQGLVKIYMSLVKRQVMWVRKQREDLTLRKDVTYIKKVNICVYLGGGI